MKNFYLITLVLLATLFFSYNDEHKPGHPKVEKETKLLFDESTKEIVFSLEKRQKDRLTLNNPQQ